MSYSYDLIVDGEFYNVDAADYDTFQDFLDATFAQEPDNIEFKDSLVNSRANAELIHEAYDRLSIDELNAYVTYCSEILGHLCEVDYFKKVFLGLYYDYEDIVREALPDLPEDIPSNVVDWVTWAGKLGLNVVHDGRHYLLFSE